MFVVFDTSARAAELLQRALLLRTLRPSCTTPATHTATTTATHTVTTAATSTSSTLAVVRACARLSGGKVTSTVSGATVLLGNVRIFGLPALCCCHACNSRQPYSAQPQPNTAQPNTIPITAPSQLKPNPVPIPTTSQPKHNPTCLPSHSTLPQPPAHILPFTGSAPGAVNERLWSEYSTWDAGLDAQSQMEGEVRLT